MSSIYALDIIARIGFGIAGAACGGKSLIVRAAILEATKDIGAGAVEHAGDGLNPIAGEGVVKDASDRHGPCDGTFEAQRSASRSGNRRQARSLRRKEIFICGHHVLAVIEGALDQLRRIHCSADELDDEIDLRIVDDRTSVARKKSRG